MWREWASASQGAWHPRSVFATTIAEQRATTIGSRLLGWLHVEHSGMIQCAFEARPSVLMTWAPTSAQLGHPFRTHVCRVPPVCRYQCLCQLPHGHLCPVVPRALTTMKCVLWFGWGILLSPADRCPVMP